MKVCIICQKDETKTSMKLKVKDDQLIRVIRTIKSSIGVAKNNELYVCDSDIQAYKERRKKFERDAVLFGAVSIGIILVMGGLPLLAGQFNLFIILVSVLVAAFFFLFAVLFKYVPAVTEGSINATTTINKKGK
ncbi:hypothetical protein HYT84_00980 [Candidatus Micrarchaeota archaeon]|nr:hypothetical protein [Candidatus Micrarchaeota archaeon]